MNTKENNKIDFKDWSPRLMRMRAELIFFSSLILIISIIGIESIDGFSFFIKINEEAFTKHVSTFYFLGIILWLYLFFAFYFRWRFERAKLESPEIISEAKKFLEHIKNNLLSISELKTDFTNSIENSKKQFSDLTQSIDQLKDDNGFIISQRNYIEKAKKLVIPDDKNDPGGEDRIQYSKTINMFLDNNQTANESLNSLIKDMKDKVEQGLLQSEKVNDSIYTQTVLEEMFKEFDNKLNRYSSVETSALKNEKADKVFFGIGIPLIYSFVCFCCYLISSNIVNTIICYFTK